VISDTRIAANRVDGAILIGVERRPDRAVTSSYDDRTSGESENLSHQTDRQDV